jgi:glucan phosphoethanolaminetransferase (alkaline phosphatase superfamily)
MDTITGYLSAHPAILTMIVIFAVIIILYFVFKQFIKLALILLLIALAFAAYYYVQDPNKMTEKVTKSIETVKSGTGTVVEKSKSMYKDSKELADKATKVPRDINKLLKNSEENAGK